MDDTCCEVCVSWSQGQHKAYATHIKSNQLKKEAKRRRKELGTSSMTSLESEDSNKSKIDVVIGRDKASHNPIDV